MSKKLAAYFREIHKSMSRFILTFCICLITHDFMGQNAQRLKFYIPDSIKWENFGSKVNVNYENQQIIGAYFDVIVLDSINNHLYLARCFNRLMQDSLGLLSEQVDLYIGRFPFKNIYREEVNGVFNLYSYYGLPSFRKIRGSLLVNSDLVLFNGQNFKLTTSQMSEYAKKACEIIDHPIRVRRYD